MRAWSIARMAVGGLRRAPLRATLTAMGVAIAAGALLTMVGFATGVRRQAETPFRTLDLFKNIEVKPHDAGESGDPAALDDAALRRMEEIAGVELVYPDIRVRGLTISHGDHSTTGIALAAPQDALTFGTAEDMLVAGRFFDANGREAVLGSRLARELGFQTPAEALGATVTMEAAGLAATDTTTFTFRQERIDVVVVGVFDTPPLMPGHAQRIMLLPVGLMKAIPRMPDGTTLDMLKAGKSATSLGYRSATVRVRNPADLIPVEAQIRQLGFRTRTIAGRFEEIHMFLVFLEVLLAAIGAVALVVAALGIVNTLLMSVTERYQEIGIYKAVGASDTDLAVLFLTEAGLLGALGGLTGLGLGWGFARLIELAVNFYARSQDVQGHLALFDFPWWLLGAILMFSTIVSILAGIYPAMRAARVDPIRVLRRDW
ncbi:MAG: ABC transporter permease [Thermoguttaceae bacterium]|nr:ABC transporter permease [Thermoguttaceae bacterium]